MTGELGEEAGGPQGPILNPFLLLSLGPSLLFLWGRIHPVSSEPSSSRINDHHRTFFPVCLPGETRARRTDVPSPWRGSIWAPGTVSLTLFVQCWDCRCAPGWPSSMAVTIPVRRVARRIGSNMSQVTVQGLALGRTVGTE